MQAPSVSRELMRRIKRVAGRRLGREVAVEWDFMQERWVIMAFDTTTGRVDCPYMIVQNGDGSYRPLDDRIVQRLRKESARDIEREQKDRRIQYKIEAKRVKHLAFLFRKYGWLRDAIERRRRCMESSPLMGKAYDDVQQEILSLCEGDQEYLKETARKILQYITGSKQIAVTAPAAGS